MPRDYTDLATAGHSLPAHSSDRPARNGAVVLERERGVAHRAETTVDLSTRQQDLVRLVAGAGVDTPAGWRWIGACAVRSDRIDLARAPCPAEYRESYEAGVRDQREGRIQPRIHDGDAIRKRLERAIRALSDEDERALAGPLDGVEIVDIEHQMRARGAGGTFRIRIEHEGAVADVAGLDGRALGAYSRIRSRAREAGLLLPPGGRSPNRAWEEVLARAWPNRRVVDIPECGDLGAAIEEAISDVLASSETGETHDDLVTGHVLHREGRLLIYPRELIARTRNLLAEDGPTRRDVIDAAVSLGGVYHGGASTKGLRIDGREVACISFPAAVAAREEDGP